MAAMDVEDAAYGGIWWFVDEIVVGMGGRGREERADLRR
jgi:hypothetical protein